MWNRAQCTYIQAYLIYVFTKCPFNASSQTVKSLSNKFVRSCIFQLWALTGFKYNPNSPLGLLVVKGVRIVRALFYNI